VSEDNKIMEKLILTMADRDWQWVNTIHKLLYMKMS